ncbi:S1 family peptidase [Desulfofustis glycolicus]|nr:serine protease [Desulfofustis glycolicus]
MRKIVVIFFVLLSLLDTLSFAENVKLQRAIPFGILNRVFPFAFGEHAGSCFIIDDDDRQYIITARHLVSGISEHDTIRILINEVWRNIEVVPIFPENDKTDIVALAGNKLVAPKMEILIGAGGMYVGQDVYFLGFPFGLATQFDKPTTSRIAFIKKAILSAVDTRPDSGNIIYLDGHNNPGFSGGPVIFANYEQHERLQIAGVVSGYKNQPTKVMSALIEDTKSNTNDSKKKIVHYILENTGIVVAYHFSEIEKAIKNKPIGFPLPKTKE